MQRWNKIFWFLILILVISCQYDPYAHKYVTEEPIESEFIGVYVFEKQTVDYKITEFKDTETNSIVIPKIEIKKDGTYQVVNFPVFENWDPIYTGLITNSGKWNKTTVSSTSDGMGELKSIWGLNLNGLPKESKNAILMNKKRPHDLLFGFGDPDEGNVMIFKKE